MKKLILSVLVLSMAIAAGAQYIPERKREMPGKHERKHSHHRMDFKALNLTEEQKGQFKEQHESFRKKMEELKKNDNITVKDWKSKMGSLRKDHQTKMQSLLTSDQKGQLEKMKVEGKAKHEARAKEMGEKMKTKLGLTNEQSDKLTRNRAEMAEKMKVLREDKNMDLEKKKEKMKELGKEQKEKMKSILTEEQLKKLKETRKERPERKERSERKQTI